MGEYSRDGRAALDCQSVGFVESLLARYRRDPQAVSQQWRDYFADLGIPTPDCPPEGRPSFVSSSIFHPPMVGTSSRFRDGVPIPAEFQARVERLVHAYRVRGHLAARLDPLGLRRKCPPDLLIGTYGLDERDLEKTCSAKAIGGPDAQPLRDLIGRLQSTYCRFIGVEFMYIADPSVREWLAHRMESSQNRLEMSREQQLEVLTHLTDAVTFEEFVRKKYIGAKTFSLEGAETLIPLLDLAIDKAGLQGAQGIVIGMAHRGRLNVLANIIGKSPQEIFWEFEDPQSVQRHGRGDVKYHLGYSGDWVTREGNRIHLSLCFNPSHLEYVNPVALGRTRAKQDRIQDLSRRRWSTLLIHGDASVAGEGIVQESLNLSQLAGYRTGGTLHVIVNNQLGFTTSPQEGRSTVYASDIAKLLQVPVFHVNGEHPEAVAQVVDLAMDFREKFQQDVFIDMYCYRRWGHNEADEPGFTQPVMYQAIEHRQSIRDSYLDHLLKLGEVTREEADEIAERRHAVLRREFEAAQGSDFAPREQSMGHDWTGYLGGPERDDDDPPTGVPANELTQLLQKLTSIPDDFHLHRKLHRNMEARRAMLEGTRPVDWSVAEALAMASLASGGHPIRFSGQDSARGTFSQRHAVVYDTVDGHAYCPLQHLRPDQAQVEIINSPLSEAGVLAFEYGYSMDYPEALVLWEAQYGDFWNVAQVIVDQFLASAEDKWKRLSGIVLLLPHGFEGQGPEHSSARLERFLSLVADDNLQIVCPSTPAQYFHCLRRQVERRWRKPLIMLTPKSLLRHPEVVSPMDDLAQGRFERILADPLDPANVQRILLCTGKIYYELKEVREQMRCHQVAILRIEQLYPLKDAVLEAALRGYRPDTPVYWVQEEPSNMGAAPYWRLRFCERFLHRYPFRTIARTASASPATGSSAAHKYEQQQLIQAAFEGLAP